MVMQVPRRDVAAPETQTTQTTQTEPHARSTTRRPFRTVVPGLRGGVGLLATLIATLLLLQHVLVALSGVVWWAFDDGPLAQHPEDVLAEASPVGAVRAFGDYPGADPTLAAQDTVDDLVAEGGLEKSTVMVAMPTGSGWVDPDQVEAMEQWADGDIASVAVRYGRTPSAVTFLMRPEVAVESATALLKEVTERVAALPEQDRPDVVVHGQSLGVVAGMEAVETVDAAAPADDSPVAAQIWQGRPGSQDAPESDRCTVDAVNADDPVADLDWDLAADPGEALGVLADLPGSESATPGSLHSYRPELPPEGCAGDERLA
jgi:hypothetical protein